MPEAKECYTIMYRTSQDTLMSGSWHLAAKKRPEGGVPQICFDAFSAQDMASLLSLSMLMAGCPLTGLRIVKTETANCKWCSGVEDLVFDVITPDDIRRQAKEGD